MTGVDIRKIPKTVGKPRNSASCPSVRLSALENDVRSPNHELCSAQTPKNSLISTSEFSTFPALLGGLLNQ